MRTILEVHGPNAAHAPQDALYRLGAKRSSREYLEAASKDLSSWTQRPVYTIVRGN